MKTAKNPAAFMHRSGLLAKVNKEVLFPLGLALYYAEGDDGQIALQGLGVHAQEDGAPIDSLEVGREGPARERLAAYLEHRRLRPEDVFGQFDDAA